MNGTIEYKGYTGSVEFSKEDGVFFGEVLGIHSLVSYEGQDRASLEEDFRGAVDDYLALCTSEGTSPENPTSPYTLWAPDPIPLSVATT